MQWGLSRRPVPQHEELEGSSGPAAAIIGPAVCTLYAMISPEELVGEEWAAWYRLSPVKKELEILQHSRVPQVKR